MIWTFHYRCTDCGRVFERDEVRYLCPDCSKDWKIGTPLKGVRESVFDYLALRKSSARRYKYTKRFEAIEEKWNYRYPVGNTPFFRADRLGEAVQLKNLWIKFDGANPSGSLKDRASYMMVCEALRLREKTIVTASTGNAASALAAAAASAGKRAVIFAPASAPKAKLVQMMICGATVIPVAGDYDDAFRLSIEFTERYGGLNRNTAYHPLTIEGKKVAGLEMFEQSAGVPDAIVIPVGDGVILHGVYKAFYDLLKAGWIKKVPMMICVQAENSAAIHNFVTTGEYHSLDRAETVADSISVRIPSNAYNARRSIVESNGFTLTVTDDEILSAQKLLATTEGIFAEPSSSAVVAALSKPEFLDRLPPYGQIALLVTGHGLKDVPAAERGITIPKAIEPTIDAIPQSLVQSITGK